MKKLLLLLTFVITSLYASAAAPIYVEIDSITYRVRANDAGVYKAERSITQANIASNVTYNGVEYPVTYIEDYAFQSRSNLTSVTIPNSVKSIRKGAFDNCYGLTRVDISDLEAWCKISFYEAVSNPLSYAHHLYLNGEELTTMIIPDSIETIEDFAFDECYGLTSVTIPNSVKSIHYCAFYNCYRLKRVDISDLEAWCKISFWDMSANPLCPGKADLYLNGEKVVDLTIPNTIEYMRGWTFVGCSSIETVRFSEGCKRLSEEYNTFGALHLFRDCVNLKEVYLSSTITDIYGYCTFAYCPAMETVYCYAMTPPAYKYHHAFEESYPENMTLHVPQGTKDAYASSSPWNQFGIIIDDLEQASVEDVIANDMSDGIVVYNLQGIRMDVSNGDELNSLPAGLYIVNGKKLIVNDKKL